MEEKDENGNEGTIKYLKMNFNLLLLIVRSLIGHLWPDKRGNEH
jgi:hypothetical protein